MARSLHWLLLAAAFAAPAGGQVPMSGATRVAGAVSPLTPHRQVELIRTKLDYETAPIALRIELPPLDTPKPPSDARPTRIGIHRDVPSRFRGDLAPQLIWTQLAGGAIVTSISLSAPGAVSLRVGLRAELPDGGEIRLFDPTAPGRRLPPVAVDDFTDAGGGDAETIWLPSVDGDEVGIEIALPSWEAAGAFSLVLEKVAHRYASLWPPHGFAKNLECAGHIDVQCRTGRFPRGLENAVGRIRFEKDGETSQCSGSLLNVPATDEYEPYFLTANHCVSTRSVASTVETLWFYQRISCGSSDVDYGYLTRGGADLLKTSEAQDSTLLRLKGDLPGGLFYSGWSTRAIAHPRSVYSISHPQGDVKKFAAGRTVGPVSIDIGFVVEDAYEIEWTEGATERGSSGSGLFYGDGFLIGVFSGVEPGSCVSAYAGSFADFYPRISRWIRPANTTAPDLVVESPSVTISSLRSGQRFTLSATVRNRGDGRSAATVLRYYRSSNSSITRGDAAVATDGVSALAASGTSRDSAALSAPSTPGTWYYGACVDEVSGESRTDNNCSAGVRVTVTSDGGGTTDQGGVRGQATLGDFDGDGRADVLLRHSRDGRWHYHRMVGRTVVSGTGPASLTRNLSVAVAGIGDLNGDGRDDVLVRRANGTWYYYPLSGRRILSGRGDVPLPRDRAWAVAGIGDFDGDGRDDVLLRHSRDGRWHYHRMVGRRVVWDGAASLTRNLSVAVAGIGDLNGDGRDDVLVRRANGTWYYYPMSGRRILSGRGDVPLPRDRAWAAAGIGDFDGDGRDDVLLRHSRDGRWHYHRMVGRRVVWDGAASLTRNLSVAVAGIGDLNGDGRDDVLVRRANGTWYYYPMSGRRILSGRGDAPLPRDRAWAVAGAQDGA